MSAKFIPTNFTVDNAATYKANLDANFAVLAQIGAAFQPYANETPAMNIKLAAGSIANGVGSSPVTKAVQTTGTITAPVGNPRIDRVVIDAITGVLSVITGTPAASPAAPAITSGKIPVAQILLQTSSTIITASMITDERPLLFNQGIAQSDRTGAQTITTSDNGQLINFTGGSDATWGFTAVATMGAGWWALLCNAGTADVTLDPNGSETIDGLTSFIMYPGEVRLVMCTGSAFVTKVLRGFSKIFTSSGTFITPPGYRNINVHAIAGGGGGGVRSGGGGGGGGGGAGKILNVPAGTAGASVTVTVGAGGAAASAGGDTTLTIGAIAILGGGGKAGGAGASGSGNGGAGGNSLVSGNGGGGGGGGGAGSNAGTTGGAGGSSSGGAGGGKGAGVNVLDNSGLGFGVGLGFDGGSSINGGGGGGAGRQVSSGTSTAGAGGYSQYGGGGGGGGAGTGGSESPGAAGTSAVGGAGGAGGGATGGSGTVPGGGGGGNSGVGAAGEVRIRGGE